MTTSSASREISRMRRGTLRARLPSERHFRNGGAIFEQDLEQLAVLVRIESVMAAGEYGNGAGQQAGAMDGGIVPRGDAAGSSGPP